MASHRKPRPAGTRGPGLRGPALATAAFTSVAVLSQTAEAAPADDGRPSLEEIEKKIDEFYRRADSAPEEESAARQRARAEEQAAARQRARAEDQAARERALTENRTARETAPGEDRTVREQAHPGDGTAGHRALTGDRTAPEWARAGEPRQEGARRAARRARPREGLAPFTVAPDPAASLLAEYPQDHFAQHRVMNRLASHVKDAAGRGRATRTTETPETPAAAPYDVKGAKATVQRKLVLARELLSRLTAEADSRPAALPQEKQPDVGPQAHVVSGPEATRAEKAIAFARAQIGKPYVSGASGPGSYDCSGLTQAAWKAAGVTLPRAARDQAVAGTVVALDDARPGDLVFFREDSSHVGLCTGDGMMIHAPGPGAYVREQAVHHTGEPVIHSVVRPV
ncbi:C40 family peptidase [Streptomyces sp. NPDC051133]|uniref:C40 family peptidase n=1 Tax=Streptomyces sp. NPDC051133 TaxID=3155521 RepID=UPI00344010DD